MKIQGTYYIQKNFKKNNKVGGLIMFPLQNLQQSYRNKDCVVLTGSTGRHKDQ